MTASVMLPIDPLPALAAWDDPALAWFVQRDLLQETAPPVEILWALPEAARLVRRQQADGSWRYPGKSFDPRTGTNYNLLETYRQLGVLVEMFGLTRNHPALQQAAAYVFSCQTGEGDIRGILGNQTMPYYHGALLELLIKASYGDDLRVKQGLDWLLAVRQDDGGWVIPAQLVAAHDKTPEFWRGPTLPPDRAKPHSHLATGMALRAFAAHSVYRQRSEAQAAGNALKARLFQPDKYYDRRAPSYWLKFQFPFWWNSLLTTLDTLSWLGSDPTDPQVAQGLNWFRTHQSADGLWETGYGSGPRAEGMRRWVGLAICRVLQRFQALESGR